MHSGFTLAGDGCTMRITLASRYLLFFFVTCISATSPGTPPSMKITRSSTLAMDWPEEAVSMIVMFSITGRSGFFLIAAKIHTARHCFAFHAIFNASLSMLNFGFFKAFGLIMALLAIAGASAAQ